MSVQPQHFIKLFETKLLKRLNPAKIIMINRYHKYTVHQNIVIIATQKKNKTDNVPQCLCFWPPPQSSPVVPEFCPLYRPSYRSTAGWTPQGHSF